MSSISRSCASRTFYHQFAEAALRLAASPRLSLRLTASPCLSLRLTASPRLSLRLAASPRLSLRDRNCGIIKSMKLSFARQN
ncbi:MAG: hypothetical protein RSG78_01280 [Oscillospiraceae bacterium]